MWTGSALTTIGTGTPLPFETQPFSYDVAFGGIDHAERDPTQVDMFLENPVGRGFRTRRFQMQDVPMPLTEQASAPIDDPLLRMPSR